MQQIKEIINRVHLVCSQSILLEFLRSVIIYEAETGTSLIKHMDQWNAIKIIPTLAHSLSHLWKYWDCNRPNCISSALNSIGYFLWSLSLFWCREVKSITKRMKNYFTKDIVFGCECYSPHLWEQWNFDYTFRQIEFPCSLARLIWLGPERSYCKEKLFCLKITPCHKH